MPGRLRSALPARLLSLALALVVLTQAVSCGTLLYPERIGQPRGRLDPGVVVLDACGLLLFFVPGVIAFAVDFTNGTIYLPPEDACCAKPVDLAEMTAVHVDPRSLDERKIESVLASHRGRQVRLAADPLRIRPVRRGREFRAAYAEMLSDGEHLAPARLRFGRESSGRR